MEIIKPRARPAVRFNHAVVKTGPLYRRAQPVAMPLFLPLDGIGAWYRADDKLRIQLSQRIVEVGLGSEEERHFARVVANKTELKMPGEWCEIVHQRVPYAINLARAPLIVIGTGGVRVFQHAGSFLVPAAQAAKASEIRQKVANAGEWVGPYRLPGDPESDYEERAYLRLSEIDRLKFAGAEVVVFPHGSAQGIVLHDDQATLRALIQILPDWISVDAGESLNVGCAAFYATGPLEVSEPLHADRATRHNERGLHYGSQATVSVASSDEAGRDSDAAFQTATRQWLPFQFGEDNGSIRINPARVEILVWNEPQSFILMSEGRYHWHGPLTDALRSLHASFIITTID